jgi:hypothetical protein
MSVPPRIAFSTLAFPDATLAAAVGAGRRWGYAGIEEPEVALPEHLDVLTGWLESAR